MGEGEGNTKRRYPGFQACQDAGQALLGSRVSVQCVNRVSTERTKAYRERGPKGALTPPGKVAFETFPDSSSVNPAQYIKLIYFCSFPFEPNVPYFSRVTRPSSPPRTVGPCVCNIQLCWWGWWW